MNIVVAMKQVPDLQQIRIRNQRPVLEDVPYTFGALDKNALQAGVDLQAAMGGKLTVLCIGGSDLVDTVKEALAGGADDAYIIADDEFKNLDSAQTAFLIAEAVKNMEEVGLVLFGEGSGDNYSGQVVGRVAECLNLPQICYAKEISLQGSMLVVKRVLEDCEEVLEAGIPAVVSVVAEINEVKIPSVTQILKAGKKPKKVLEADDITAVPEGIVQICSSLAPENNRRSITVKNAAELLAALKAENLL